MLCALSLCLLWLFVFSSRYWERFASHIRIVGHMVVHRGRGGGRAHERPHRLQISLHREPPSRLQRNTARFDQFHGRSWYRRPCRRSRGCGHSESKGSNGLRLMVIDRYPLGDCDEFNFAVPAGWRRSRHGDGHRDRAGRGRGTRLIDAAGPVNGRYFRL